jgi:hypothetical protein
MALRTAWCGCQYTVLWNWRAHARCAYIYDRCPHTTMASNSSHTYPHTYSPTHDAGTRSTSSGRGPTRAPRGPRWVGASHASSAPPTSSWTPPPSPSKTPGLCMHVRLRVWVCAPLSVCGLGAKDRVALHLRDVALHLRDSKSTAHTRRPPALCVCVCVHTTARACGCSRSRPRRTTTTPRGSWRRTCSTRRR